MCAIAGIFNIDGRPVSINILRKMADVVKHRGPDSEGFWTQSFVGLAHRRLAILDLSPRGHQPMQNDDGTLVIVYNGEAYNFQNIRVELEAKGFMFHSKTDTEVVLKAYEAWGESCVERFNGMFAFAIWNSHESSLFIARDRYGIKPLYYYFKNNMFIFGSEIKSIIQHPDVPVRVCVPALNEYFSFQNILTDLTLFDGIKLLPAGYTLSLQLGDMNSLTTKQYWDFNLYQNMELEEEECVRELVRLFEQAVNRFLVSDVEIGSYLSGGIDSGSITCIAAKNFGNIKTFTCGFDLSSASGLELNFDERQKAEYLSYLYKTEHYEVVLKAGDMERVMPQLIWQLEDLRVGQSYPNYYVARLASKFIKVILSGTGGDELFAGYPWRYYRPSKVDDLEAYLEGYYRYWQRLIPDRIKPEFYQPDIYPQVSSHPTIEIFKSIIKNKHVSLETPEAYVNASLYFELKTFLHGLLEVEDKHSMAHSLEVRVPFLDNDLVDFAMQIPVKYKLNNLDPTERLNENEPGIKRRQYVQQTNDGKIVLRKSLSQYINEDYTKSIKQGFSAPDSSWFKGESINYIRDLLFDKRARIYNYIQPQKAQKLMNEHFSGKRNRRLLIWSLLCFEWWNRTFDT